MKAAGAAIQTNAATFIRVRGGIGNHTNAHWLDRRCRNATLMSQAQTLSFRHTPQEDIIKVTGSITAAYG